MFCLVQAKTEEPSKSIQANVGLPVKLSHLQYVLSRPAGKVCGSVFQGMAETMHHLHSSAAPFPCVCMSPHTSPTPSGRFYWFWLG